MFVIEEKIARELNIPQKSVSTVLNLFEEGATIPFIARYRKEKTGGLNEEHLRKIEERFSYLMLLENRKQTVLDSIEKQGELTEELKKKILLAEKLQEVEDLYLPYKPKRKTRAMKAKEKGLEPLAEFILMEARTDSSIEEKAKIFIDEENEIPNIETAISYASDIIAEAISETAEVRKSLREAIRKEGQLITKKIERKTDEKIIAKDVYEIYHDFRSPLLKIKPHQTLAINRGEKEKFLKVTIDYNKEKAYQIIRKKYFEGKNSFFGKYLTVAIEDSYTRLIFPSLERELRKEITEIAEEHAIEVFATNLRQLLLQPPVFGKIIMGIDPGFVSGSKVAVIDKTGKYLEGKTIYPHPPQNKRNEAKEIISYLIKKYKVDVIAIGNGTASRETEQLIAELIKENNLQTKYVIVNEAGASVYSASKLAKEEFPELEASMRGNITIARRLLDPLSELVKIDPKSIGVGLYQHDVNQKNLSKKLDDVVESCVNFVGVDLNTASVPLLTYVSGLNKAIAKRIVKYREDKGKFENREELKNVSGVGEKVFEQSAGFLKIANGENPLDNTFIHPESYDAVNKLLSFAKIDSNKISEAGLLIEKYVNKNGLEKTAKEIGVGVPTLIDIVENLKKPGRDPREDLPKPILRNDILKLEDLQEGMKLKGTVRNIVDFGAFVDIGLKNDALLHISEMSDSFVKNPHDILSVGDIIDVEIKSVDFSRERVSLTKIS